MPPDRLTIRNFAQIANVDIDFGDLTVLVGAQGAGKSIALQWLKAALDGKQITDSLRASGNTLDKSIPVDLIFGTGMGPAWDEHSEITFNDRKISPTTIPRLGGDDEKLFFIPAQRSLLLSEGWALPFHKLSPDTPVVARIFSQNLHDHFSSQKDGALFPRVGRLKTEYRDLIDSAVFHGGKVSLREERPFTRRLHLAHAKTSLPYIAWTAGQREFTPMLLSLYYLLPSQKMGKQRETDWVVIEEPEMGLHPQAITAVMLLVLDLLWRGYRVVLSTHSPHVLTTVWMLQQLQLHKARETLVCEAFGVPKSQQVKRVAKSALTKDYKVHLLAFEEDGKVHSKDISSLDPGSDDDQIAGWGGLTGFSSRLGDAVRTAVNESGA